MKRFLPIITFLVGCVLGGAVVWGMLACRNKTPAKSPSDVQGRDPAPLSPEKSVRHAAVTISLEKFFALKWDLPEPAVYVKPSEYSKAVPSTLAGKKVEIILEEALIKRYAGRPTAPRFVSINVFDVPGRPEVDFCVSISVTGAVSKDFRFKAVPLGGARVYEFTVVSGQPVLGKTTAETI